MAEVRERLRQMARAYVLGAGLAVLLAGCGSLGTPPPAVMAVDKPVYWCPEIKVSKPAFAVDGMPLGLDAYDQMKHLRADRLQRQAYEAELEAALSGRSQASAAQ